MQNVEFYYTAEIIALIPYDNVPCEFSVAVATSACGISSRYNKKSPTDWTASPSPVTLIASFLL